MESAFDSTSDEHGGSRDERKRMRMINEHELDRLDTARDLETIHNECQCDALHDTQEGRCEIVQEKEADELDYAECAADMHAVKPDPVALRLAIMKRMGDAQSTATETPWPFAVNRGHVAQPKPSAITSSARLQYSGRARPWSEPVETQAQELPTSEPSIDDQPQPNTTWLESAQFLIQARTPTDFVYDLTNSSRPLSCTEQIVLLLMFLYFYTRSAMNFMRRTQSRGRQVLIYCLAVAAIFYLVIFPTMVTLACVWFLIHGVHLFRNYHIVPRSLLQSHVATANMHSLSVPEMYIHRYADTVDTFADYNYRNDSHCQISSLSLHTPFSPVCTTREEFLNAFTSGGRIGFGSPFMPQGCDMEWFNTSQVCEVFSRFEKVIVVGDSMMRHVVGALNVLLRQDLGYGAVTNWNFSDQEMKECFCNHQMDVKDCSLQGIYSTSSVRENDPDSLACPASQSVDLVIEMMLKFPLDPTEVKRFKDLIATEKPKKPYAFVFGHGLWNDLDLQATLNWLDGILQHTLEQAPYLEKSLWPRLFITPNAAGIRKPDEWLVSQGDKALQMFEKAMRIEARMRGVEHLGTWNMSIQMEKYDGVHLDLKGNLIKAMGVMNWLSLVEVEKW